MFHTKGRAGPSSLGTLQSVKVLLIHHSISFFGNTSYECQTILRLITAFSNPSCFIYSHFTLLLKRNPIFHALYLLSAVPPTQCRVGLTGFPSGPAPGREVFTAAHAGSVHPHWYQSTSRTVTLHSVLGPAAASILSRLLPTFPSGLHRLGQTCVMHRS